MTIQLSKIKETSKYIKYKTSSEDVIATVYIKKELAVGKDNIEVSIGWQQEEEKIVVIG